MSDNPATGEFGPAQTFRAGGRTFVRGEVPHGINRGQPFALAQRLAGRYEVWRFFASGGMGLVLEGRDRRTGAGVLIKSTLRYEIMPYAKARDREGFTNQLRVPRKVLETERRILVLLRNGGCNAVPHPNDFVFDSNPLLAGPFEAEDGSPWRYDDAEMIDAEPYLVMEAVSGRPLEELLRPSGGGASRPFSEARALRVTYQIAGVLRALHQSRELRLGMTWRLIYQDLKPANVLLSDLDRVTLLDLGGCQLLNVATGQKLLQGSCTSGYCPPECEQPYDMLTPAADVYTVGSTLYDMLTGHSPLDLLGSSLPDNQPRAVRLDTRLLEGRCRPATRQLVERCLAPNPSDRYPDADALARALEEVIQTP
jgi:serine/threonine protein kinase